MKAKTGKLFFAAIAALTVLAPVRSEAVTTNIDALVTFVAAITLTPTAMDFGDVMYSSDPSVAGDFVKLGTNGTRSAGGVFTTAGGTVVAGDVAITGTFGVSVSVSCDSTAIMGNGAGKTINIINIEVSKESTTANHGSGNACTGIGNNILSFTLTSGTDDQVKVGGQITGTGASSPFATGAYSTATGGNDIQIDIVYT